MKRLLYLAQKKNKSNTENKKQKKESGLAEEKQSGEKAVKKIMIKEEIKEKEYKEE